MNAGFKHIASVYRLGLVVDPGKRIYYYEDCSMYQIVEMAEQSARQNLGSPILRERLLFSYRVLEYMRQYRKEDILPLKRNQSQATQPMQNDKNAPDAEE